MSLGFESIIIGVRIVWIGDISVGTANFIAIINSVVVMVCNTRIRPIDLFLIESESVAINIC